MGFRRTTTMIRLECNVCSMTALCVKTSAVLDLWEDHMAIHPDQSDYEAWVWEVMSLPLD